MAFLQCEFKSEILGVACSLNVILNEKALKAGQGAHKCPVLYLLHGLSDTHSAWTRKTSIERYADEYDVAIVMPSVGRSFYANMHAGYRYFDFISEELPEIAKSFFPIAPGRQNTFAAGLSMGGYGAFKLALSKPNQYAAAASLSGALDLQHLKGEEDDLLPEWRNVFGDFDTFKNSENNLNELASKLAKNDPSKIPKLYQYCGTEDFLYPINTSFKAHCDNLSIPIEYFEDDGDHTWGHWDREIQKVLAWLPIDKLEENPKP